MTTTAQQITITIPAARQDAILEALAAVLGPGECWGMSLRRVQVPAVPPADGGTGNGHGLTDDDLEALITGAGWGIDPARSGQTLRNLRRARLAGIGAHEIRRGLAEARNRTAGPRGTVMHGVGAVGWLEEETYTTKTGSRTRYRWRWRAVQGPGARGSKKCSHNLGTR